MKLLALIVFLPLSAAALPVFRDYFDINRPAILFQEQVVNSRGNVVSIYDAAANLGIDIQNERIFGPESVTLVCVKQPSDSNVESGFVFFRGNRHSFFNPQDCARVEQAWLQGRSLRMVLHRKRGIIRVR